MYFEMKSFWNCATRGGRALAAHSTGVAVSKLPLTSATRTVISLACRFASAPAQRDQSAVVHVLRAGAGVGVADLVAADPRVVAVRRDAGGIGVVGKAVHLRGAVRPRVGERHVRTGGIAVVLAVRLDVQEAARVVRERVGTLDHDPARDVDRALGLGLRRQAVLRDLGGDRLARPRRLDLEAALLEVALIRDHLADPVPVGAQLRLAFVVQVDRCLGLFTDEADVEPVVLQCLDHRRRVLHHHQALSIRRERRGARSHREQRCSHQRRY